MNPNWRRGVRAALVALEELAEVAGSRPPLDGAYPWLQTLWDTNEVEAMHGDGKTTHISSDLELHLWEKMETEDGTAAAAVKTALNGEKFSGVRLGFSSANRLTEDGDLVHTVLIFSVKAPFAS